MDDDYISKILTLHTGKGKAIRLTANLKTPGGWIRMGDVKVGDVLVSHNGDHTKITGVYPQGKLQLYRITFEDGRNIECCKEHLWRYYNPNHGWAVGPLDKIHGLLEHPDIPWLGIPLCDRLEDTEPKNMALTPRQVGMTLGRWMLEGRVPDCYAYAEQYTLLPYSQRIEFLDAVIEVAGELEFDDTITIMYSTEYDMFPLLRVIAVMARSLGHLAIAEEYGGPQGILTITYRKHCEAEALRIVSIEPSEIDEAQCISVDHPSRLYITDDYIVTHNTYCSLRSAEHYGIRIMVQVFGKYIE